MAGLTNNGILTPLAALDRISRKLQRLADTIRFSGYGYSGLFASIPVDEKKLLELYDYDLSLNTGIEELAMHIGLLRQRSSNEWNEATLDELLKFASRLEEKIAQRELLFTTP